MRTLQDHDATPAPGRGPRPLGACRRRRGRPRPRGARELAGVRREHRPALRGRPPVGRHRQRVERLRVEHGRRDPSAGAASAPGRCVAPPARSPGPTEQRVRRTLGDQRRRGLHVDLSGRVSGSAMVMASTTRRRRAAGARPARPGRRARRRPEVPPSIQAGPPPRSRATRRPPPACRRCPCGRADRASARARPPAPRRGARPRWRLEAAPVALALLDHGSPPRFGRWQRASSVSMASRSRPRSRCDPLEDLFLPVLEAGLDVDREDEGAAPGADAEGDGHREVALVADRDGDRAPCPAARRGAARGRGAARSAGPVGSRTISISRQPTPRTPRPSTLLTASLAAQRPASVSGRSRA